MEFEILEDHYLFYKTMYVSRLKIDLKCIFST